MSSAEKTKDREVWPDLLKGFAIVLVVFGHAWRGDYATGLFDGDAALFLSVDSRIYAFHMPLFFLASGLFLAGSIAGRTQLSFVAGRLRGVVWPLILWTYLFWLTKLAAGDAANDPASMQLPFPIPGYLHLWFLWALFVIQILVLVTIGPLLGTFRHRSALWLALAASVVLATLPLPVALHYWTSSAVHYLPYLLVGMLLGDARWQWRWSIWPPLAAFVTILWFLPVLDGSVLTGLPVSASLCLCVVFMAQAAANGSGSGISLLAYLGGISMVVYLTHTIFSAAARIVLTASGIDDLTLHLVAAMAAGLIGPIGFLWITERLALVGLLGLGRIPVTTGPVRIPHAGQPAPPSGPAR